MKPPKLKQGVVPQRRSLNAEISDTKVNVNLSVCRSALNRNKLGEKYAFIYLILQLSTGEKRQPISHCLQIFGLILRLTPHSFGQLEGLKV